MYEFKSAKQVGVDDYMKIQRRKKKAFRRKYCYFLFIGILCAIISGCTSRSAVTNETPEILLQRAMEFNQNGKWKEAIDILEPVLQQKDMKLTDEQRCEIYFELTYSNHLLGNIDEAAANLNEFEHISHVLDKQHWLVKEAEKLKKEMSKYSQEEIDEDSFWVTADPRELGIAPGLVEKHRSLLEDTAADAGLMVYRGKIIQEWYSENYSTPMYAMSCTKSVTGLLTGMLMSDGRIKSIDEPVNTFLDGWSDGEKGKVTIRHLLTMTSGMPGNKCKTATDVGYVEEKDEHVISMQLEHKPGEIWDYSNNGAQLLSPILDKAAGQPIQDYAMDRLFKPLGMRNTRLHQDVNGHAWTYADMETTPRDMARIGILMLNKGKWGDRQIVGEDWIRLSTTSSQEMYKGYGLLWWLIEDPKGFAAHGYLETNLYVFPDKGLIVVRMQSKPGKNNEENTYQEKAFQIFRQIGK